MSAMEKVAWWELAVSVAAVAVVALLFPWLGARASGGFGLLGLIALGIFFLRRRGNRVAVDERDREIERRAKAIGVGTAWMTLLTALIAATMWTGFKQANAVSIELLNWLIWVQFPICYGMKGLVAIVMYRRHQHAA